MTSIENNIVFLNTFHNLELTQIGNMNLEIPYNLDFVNVVATFLEEIENSSGAGRSS
jgi:hypothetical protein